MYSFISKQKIQAHLEMVNKVLSNTLLNFPYSAWIFVLVIFGILHYTLSTFPERKHLAHTFIFFG